MRHGKIGNPILDKENVSVKVETEQSRAKHQIKRQISLEAVPRNVSITSRTDLLAVQLQDAGQQDV